MYLAFVRRKAVERVNSMRNTIIGGMWANSNYDDDKGTRNQAISAVNMQADMAIAEIYDPPDQSGFDMSDPFWAAMKVPEAPEGMTAYDESKLKELGVDLDQV